MSVAAAHTAIQAAESLLITAGAGMGVDSGLPDFRGPQGFWRAYPAYERLGMCFSDLANPQWFETDPRLAWGFYGHRLELYRTTAPHPGFAILRKFADTRPSFVFTSNVDGAFQAAGFAEEQIEECHGSIHHLQCSVPCQGAIWANKADVAVDPASGRAVGTLPTCPSCGAVARPAILMFGDGRWLATRTEAQHQRFQRFLGGIDPRGSVVVECGAGTAIPTVRWTSEQLQSAGATLIRINPRESQGPSGTLSFADGALSVLRGLHL